MAQSLQKMIQNMTTHGQVGHQRSHGDFNETKALSKDISSIFRHVPSEAMAK